MAPTFTLDEIKMTPLDAFDFMIKRLGYNPSDKQFTAERDNLQDLNTPQKQWTYNLMREYCGV